MTEVSTAPSVVISSMMKKGMYDLLGAEERQCMRLVCHEFRQAVDALIDMLVLMLDSDICRFPAEAESMAKFHRSIPAATKLRICLVDDPFFDVVDAGLLLDQVPGLHLHH